MANTITAVIDKIFAEALATLREDAITPQLIHNYSHMVAQKKGNVIDLVAAMEGFSFRSAALLLQGLFMTPQDADQTDTVHEANSQASAPAPTEEVADVEDPDAAPARKGKGYMAEVETTLRELLAAADKAALIKWVKEELLASYRRGVEQGKSKT